MSGSLGINILEIYNAAVDDEPTQLSSMQAVREHTSVATIVCDLQGEIVSSERVKVIYGEVVYFSVEGDIEVVSS